MPTKFDGDDPKAEIMMHDNDRSEHLPVVKEIEGFRIVKAL